MIHSRASALTTYSLAGCSGDNKICHVDANTMVDGSTNGHATRAQNTTRDYFSPLEKQERDGEHPSDSPQRTGSRPPRIFVERTSNEVNVRDRRTP